MEASYSPEGSVERDDRLGADDLGRVPDSGRNVDPVARSDIEASLADGDPQDALHDGIALRTGVLVLGKDGAGPIGVDEHVVAFEFERAHHPLLRRRTLTARP